MIKNGAFPDSQIDTFMEAVLQLFTKLKKQRSKFFSSKNTFISELSSLPFLHTTQHDVTRKSPKKVFDSSNEELKNLFEGESVFPIAPFNQDIYLDHLRECKLRVAPNGRELLSILNTVGASVSSSNEPQKVTSIQISRARAVFSYIQNHDVNLTEQVTLPEWRRTMQPLNFSQVIQSQSTSKSFFFVLSNCPETYPTCLVWKGTGYTSHFVSNSKNVLLCGSKDISTLPHILGSQMYIVECPSKICSILSPEAPINAVLSHFQQIIQSRRDMDIAYLTNVVHHTYSFLKSNLRKLTMSQQLPLNLRKADWIWIQNQNLFVSPQVVYIQQHRRFGHDLQPYLYKLPDDLHQYSDLFTSFGVHQQLTDSKIISVLKTIKEESSKLTPDQEWRMVENILEWVSDSAHGSVLTGQVVSDVLYVPVEGQSERPQLAEVDKVVYTDLEFLKAFCESEGEPITFIHHRVAHLAASHCLGVKPLSRHINIEEDVFESVNPFKPFIEQLMDVMRDYRDGLTIIKELLQNADDAEATEFNICFDSRSHSNDRRMLIFPGMSECHGPALLVHNNAMFSDSDFTNITKWGRGTKHPLKIGKFGVGFCSVYHITDVPSFVSRDWLCIFDPTLSYVKTEMLDGTFPGKKLRFTHKLFTHSSQLKPYEGLYGFDQKKEYNGTLFRFPFRTFISDISDMKCNEQWVDQLCTDIQKCGSKLLLFLKNVKRITFSRITDGQEKTIMLDIGKENVSTVTKLSSSNDISCAEIKKVDISEPLTATSRTEYWLVSSHDTSSSSSEYATASVACLLNRSGDTVPHYIPVKKSGEVFCFLPLSYKSGLPVHVNSNFAVLNNRTGIHSGSINILARNSDKISWNIHLMEHFIPQAYHTMLLALQKMCMEGTTSIQEYQFFCFWPLKGSLKAHKPWDYFLPVLYKLISESSLFYSSCIEQWTTLSESKIISQDILCYVRSQNYSTPQCVFDVVEGLKYPVVSVPDAVVRQFSNSIKECIISEEEFLGIFFSNIQTVNSGTRNKVLIYFLQGFAISRKSYMESYLANEKCIPCTPDGAHLKSCCEIVDPCCEYGKLYGPEDGLFPIDEFHNDTLVHQALVQQKMMTNKLPWSHLIERARTMVSLFNRDARLAVNNIALIVRCIESNLKQSTNQDQLPAEASQLKVIAFFPVMDPPSTYPKSLQWKGEGQKLLNSKGLLRYENNIELVGSQASFVCEHAPKKGGCGHIPIKVSTALGFKTEPPSCNHVVNHFCHIVETYATAPEDESEIQWIEGACDKIYKYFDLQLAKGNIKSSDLSRLTGIKSIWTGREFISPSLVSTSWTHNGPHLYSVPQCLVSKVNLVNFLALQDSFSVEQLLEALKKIYDKFGTELQVDTREMDVVPKLANELEKQLGDSDLTEDQVCYLPDENRYMHNSRDLAYNDAQWCLLNSNCHFVHSIVSRSSAIKLRVKPIRSKALEHYESKTTHFEGVEFGQQDELTQRIKSILTEAPYDVSILKELLQNADNAKSSKMYIILDKRNHSQHRLPSTEWKNLQGPALLVWNESEFSQNDLEQIQKLGLGSKRPKWDSVGQYGIGFNVVYHLTNCPSFFITNSNTLCVFDPLCRYVPGVNETKPGRQYNNLDEYFWDKWSDMKTPYLREEIEGCPPEIVTGGTLFRFPLRSSKASKLTDRKPQSLSQMEKSLKEWAPMLKEALIFTSFVTDIKIFAIKDHGVMPQMQLMHHFQVDLDPTALDGRRMIHEKLSCFVEPNPTPFVVSYPLCLHEEAPYKEVEQLLVQQGVGDVQNPDVHWKYLSHIKPKHGIAVQIQGSSSKRNGLCFLPHSQDSLIPLCVDGNFILNNTRSGFWQSRDSSDTNERKVWNLRLLEAVASSYVDFLVKCREHYVYPMYDDETDMWNAINCYYKLFPNLEANLITGNEMRILTRNIYQKFGKLNSKVLVVYNTQSLSHESAISISPQLQNGQIPSTNSYQMEWLCLFNRDEHCKQAYFLEEEDRDKLLPVILMKIGMNITAAPMWIRNNFSSVDVELPIVLPYTVYEYYRRFHKQISPNGTFPCHISATVFKSIDTFLEFTRYVLEEEGHPSGTFSEPLFGLPLLLTADEQLRLFQDNSKVLHSKYSELFSASRDKFLHPDMLEMKYPMSYFVDSGPQSWELVKAILEAQLPPTLHKERVDNASEQIDVLNVLIPLLDCICDETSIFHSHVTNILKEWALIPSIENQLFACKSNEQLMPVIPPQEPPMQSLPNRIISSLLQSDNTDASNQTFIYEVFEILQECGMPTLDLSLCKETLSKKFCPELSQPDRILANVYFLFQQESFKAAILIADQTKFGKVFQYFGRIHFGQDQTSLARIKSLPLFKNIDNTYCPISGEFFTWPGTISLAGRDVWLKQSGVAFVRRGDMWSKLGEPSILGIKEISPLVIYTRFIFPYFQLLAEEDRIKQLLHIRETKGLLDKAMKDSQLEITGGHKEEGASFIAALQQLPCLPKDDELKPVCEFCDPTVEIFQVFSQGYAFPPANLSDARWLIFFRKVGLKCKATKEEFTHFCKRIGQNQNTLPASTCMKSIVKVVSLQRHKDILKASQVLLKYLFDETEWHSDVTFLGSVSQIPFVCSEPLKKLAWIKPVQKTTNKIQQGQKIIQLTSLSEGSVMENCNLVWTVMPVFSLPPFPANVPQEDIEKTYSLLGVCSTPPCSKVVQNIVNISQSRFANFKLFELYHDDCQSSEEDKELLLNVLIENFEYLMTAKCSSFELNQLKELPCIPVNSDGATTQISSPVLVKPPQVVASNSDEFFPFIIPLPSRLYSVLPGLLTEIGVQSDIQLCHINFALESIHNHIQPPINDPNTLRVLKLLLKKLYYLLQSPFSNNDSPGDTLYLPSRSFVLVQSKFLLYDDKGCYRQTHFNLSGLPYSMLSLLCEEFEELNEYGFQMKDFFRILPKQVRPLPFSTSCIDKLHESCTPVEEQSQFATKLQVAFKMEELGKCAQLILERTSLLSKKVCKQFSEAFDKFCKSVKVFTVPNLKVVLLLKLVEPPQTIGTAKVDFLLTKVSNDAFHLCLDDRAHYLIFNLIESLTSAVVSCVVNTAGIDLQDETPLENTVGMLLRVSSADEMKRVLNDLRINTFHLNIKEHLKVDIAPKLGTPIPDEWHHRFRSDINNVFRPQEWVGYEERDGCINFALVMHCIIPESHRASNDEGIQTKEVLPEYLIRVTEDDEDGRVVSIVDLYKILQVKQVQQDDGSTEFVLHIPESEGDVQLQNDEKHKEIKSTISANLQRIWNHSCSEHLKKKAIRAMYLKWHSSVKEVFLYLKQQIHRLEQDLSLTDPGHKPENYPAPHQHSYWDEQFRVWDRSTRMQRSSWQREQDYLERLIERSGQGRPVPDMQVLRWEWEKRIQVSPDLSTAKIWLEQAGSDLHVLRILVGQQEELQKVSARVCFLAHEVAEKALKAGMYKECGLYPQELKFHQLSGHAGALEQLRKPLTTGLLHLANKLEGYHLKTRYPNQYVPPSVPAALFGPDDAIEAEKTAMEVFVMMKRVVEN